MIVMQESVLHREHCCLNATNEKPFSGCLPRIQIGASRLPIALIRKHFLATFSGIKIFSSLLIVPIVIVN